MLKIKYPIYIVSKGRAYNPLTAKIFLKHEIDFNIVIEPQDFDEYKKVIPEKYIKILPFSNLGLGSFPARNWCWDHSLKNNHEKHFIFDDNIRGFGTFNAGVRKTYQDARLALHTLQEFTDRYENIAVSGYNYYYFITKRTNKPFYLNTHVYSGMLINNSIPFRWRLKYNEDVDLCLQALDKKWCTVLLNAFFIQKMSTSAKMKGGNQTELYENNDEKKKALKACSLQQVWPQYAKTAYRFGRPHHVVNWKKHFNHPLKKKAELCQK